METKKEKVKELSEDINFLSNMTLDLYTFGIYNMTTLSNYDKEIIKQVIDLIKNDRENKINELNKIIN